MSLQTPSSPHLPVRNDVSRVMLKVVLALLPGTILYAALFSSGVLVNVAIAVGAAMAAESAMLRMRGRDALPALRDGSAILSAWLLAVALPPLVPWWIPAFGAAFAMVFGKHLFGGIGYNPFNPAMLGYVVLLIAWPVEMSTWVEPRALAESATAADRAVAGAFFGGGWDVDAMSRATPLDHLRTQLSLNLPVSEATTAAVYAPVGGTGWIWVNLGWLAGGIALLASGTIRWRIPVGLLGGLALGSLPFWLADADRFASPLFHVFNGAAILGAFFIATDPVSASTTPTGRLLYGAGIGVLTWVIRTWGGYPDAIAFAVLLMNCCVPLIDQYTKPHVFGQRSGDARE